MNKQAKRTLKAVEPKNINAETNKDEQHVSANESKQKNKNSVDESANSNTYKQTSDAKTSNTDTQMKTRSQAKRRTSTFRCRVGQKLFFSLVFFWF